MANDQHRSSPGSPVASYRSTFECVLDALPDGVLLTNAERQVVYCNPAFARHWNIPTNLLEVADDTFLLRYVGDQLFDPAAFVHEVERINLTSETSQDEISLKDGRLLSRRSVPLKDPGAFATRLWIFTDVTETEYARTDALCGISNRRAYASEYPQFVEGADDGLMRSVGILDIDNFKAYNDQYGHAAGDIVLRQIGTLLRHSAVAQDGRAYRIGGEEFLLACKTQGASDALAFFEALRTGILNMQLPHTGNPPHNMVTTSIGLSIFRGPEQSSAIFDRVDAALYRAKHAGRNIIELA